MKILLIAVLATFGFSAYASDGYEASNGLVYPFCGDNAIDPDNDGWGWENEASCKMDDAAAPVVTEPSKPSTYGKGPRRIRLRTAAGTGLVRCYYAYTSEKDDSNAYWSYVKIRPANAGFISNSLKFSHRSNSKSCARNKTILECSFTYDLEWCEDNVTVW